MAEVKVKLQPPDADPVEVESRWVRGGGSVPGAGAPAGGGSLGRPDPFSGDPPGEPGRVQ